MRTHWPDAVLIKRFLCQIPWLECSLITATSSWMFAGTFANLAICNFTPKTLKLYATLRKFCQCNLLKVLSIVLVNVMEAIKKGSLPSLQIYCNCAKPLVWRLPTHATCLACCFLVFLGMSHCSMTTFNLVNFKSQILASAAMSALFTNWLMLFDSPVSS